MATLFVALLYYSIGTIAVHSTIVLQRSDVKSHFENSVTGNEKTKCFNQMHTHHISSTITLTKNIHTIQLRTEYYRVVD